MTICYNFRNMISIHQLLFEVYNFFCERFQTMVPHKAHHMHCIENVTQNDFHYQHIYTLHIRVALFFFPVGGTNFGKQV